MIITLLLQLAAASFGTIAFSIMFSVPRKYYPYCGLIGGGGWIICWCMVNFLNVSNVTGTFVATAFVALVSRISGTSLKCPAILFLMSGIFPLVPGVGIYWTVYSVIMGDMQEYSRYARQTLNLALAIVLGIIFVFEIPQKGIAAIAGIGRKKEKKS